MGSTPLIKLQSLSKLCGCDVFLKHEQFQFTGSFKERGARNALMSLSEEKKAKGVVAASARVAAYMDALTGGALTLALAPAVRRTFFESEPPTQDAEDDGRT